jgi:hypothetical protein
MERTLFAIEAILGQARDCFAKERLAVTGWEFVPDRKARSAVE